MYSSNYLKPIWKQKRKKHEKLIQSNTQWFISFIFNGKKPFTVRYCWSPVATKVDEESFVIVDCAMVRNPRSLLDLSLAANQNYEWNATVVLISWLVRSTKTNLGTVYLKMNIQMTGNTRLKLSENFNLLWDRPN